MTNQQDEKWDNRKAFPDVETWSARYKEHSIRFSESVNFKMDNQYGDRARNRIDVLPGKPDLPTLIHIHGGYWQWNDKEDYLCVGEALHRAGLNCAFLEHTLAPEATMDEIVAEVQSGVSWFSSNRGDFGIENPDIIVCGHSSGGHLAAMCQGNPNVIGTVLISGLYDIRPITQIYVNEVIGMDEEMASRNSPALSARDYGNFALIAYGDLELETFREQSRGYHAAMLDKGNDVQLFPAKNRGHFDILDELTEGNGVIFEALMDKLNLK
mgnify:CR=1 FL=1